MKIEVERLTFVSESEQRVRVKCYQSPNAPAILCDISAELAKSLGLALVDVGQSRYLSVIVADENG